MNTLFEAANAAADQVTINAIVVEAADATADRVAIPVPLYLIARGPLPLAHRTNAPHGDCRVRAAKNEREKPTSAFLNLSPVRMRKMIVRTQQSSSRGFLNLNGGWTPGHAVTRSGRKSQTDKYYGGRHVRRTRTLKMSLLMLNPNHRRNHKPNFSLTSFSTFHQFNNRPRPRIPASNPRPPRGQSRRRTVQPHRRLLLRRIPTP